MALAAISVRIFEELLTDLLSAPHVDYARCRSECCFQFSGHMTWGREGMDGKGKHNGKHGMFIWKHEGHTVQLIFGASSLIYFQNGEEYEP